MARQRNYTKEIQKNLKEWMRLDRKDDLDLLTPNLDARKEIILSASNDGRISEVLVAVEETFSSMKDTQATRRNKVLTENILMSIEVK